MCLCAPEAQQDKRRGLLQQEYRKTLAPKEDAMLDRAIVISCVDRKLSVSDKAHHVISCVDRKLSISD